MPSIQISDVPAETYRVLQVRAAASGQSLEEFLRSKLMAEAAGLTTDDVFDDLDRQPADGAELTVADVIDALGSGRRGR